MNSALLFIACAFFPLIAFPLVYGATAWLVRRGLAPRTTGGSIAKHIHRPAALRWDASALKAA